MKYTPYEFKTEDAYRFARHMNAETFERGDELHFKICPYCKGGGSGDKDSFAISLKTGQFKCLRSTCGVQGNMIKLSQDYEFSLGNEADEYIRPRKKYKTYRKPDKPPEPKPEIIQYLESRGISEATARKYEIGTYKGNDKVMAFLFYDPQGNLSLIKYRKTDFDPAKDKNKEWSDKGGKPVLFGIKQCNPKNETLILCEGQLDQLSVAECGYENTLSVPTGAKGFTWIPYCWNWIHQFKRIIVFGDHEKGHITLLDDIRSRFRTLQVMHVREEDYKDCKDANDILRKYGKEQIKVCIENAVNCAVSSVVSLADVEEINPFDIPKMPTGLQELDSLLYGGLPFGGITIITGKAGHGKSVLASQILISAMDAGHRVFAYSGELPNHLFKAWMTFQVAGKDNVFAYQTRFGETGYNVSDDNKKLISEWYRDRIDIYDSNDLGDDSEREGLLKLIEQMICQYGSDVILIDNLMTALDLEVSQEKEKYEKQSQFVKALTRIAMTHKVLIILVAHKRKNSFQANASTESNDDVAGSSDITNLAMVVLSYEKDKDLAENDRLLRVGKNRLFGKTGKWEMHYDEKCKRVYGDRGDSSGGKTWKQRNIKIEDDLTFD